MRLCVRACVCTGTHDTYRNNFSKVFAVCVCVPFVFVFHDLVVHLFSVPVRLFSFDKYVVNVPLSVA